MKGIKGHIKISVARLWADVLITNENVDKRITTLLEAWGYRHVGKAIAIPQVLQYIAKVVLDFQIGCSGRHLGED